MIKVRFPPSPTGNPHVGNIRTALFTFLFAKKNNGKFILRIEDTDKKREIPESIDAILESLRWLGLNWDEGPIRQSERLKIYKEHVEKLTYQGLAYEQDKAIYFKTKKDGITSWIDLVGSKKIEFENKTQDDFVILKSDGFPTYHLANVVDDHLMGITHVTRGEDWISSTPKHIMLYQAFGWREPFFAHFPSIFATDRSRLSKRHGAIGVLDLKKDGFLPQALLNYLALLGWTPPSGQEILTLEEMIQEFDFGHINEAPAVFDIRKLEWMNGEYIRKSQNSNLKSQILEYLKDLAGGVMPDHPTEEELEKVIPLIKERIKKLSDFIPLTDFLWEKPEYDKAQYQKLNIVNKKEALERILEKLNVIEKPWKPDVFEETFRKLAEDLGLSATQMFQLIRLAISGQVVTPPLFECIKILGEEETAIRVREAKSFLETT